MHIQFETKHLTEYGIINSTVYSICKILLRVNEEQSIYSIDSDILNEIVAFPGPTCPTKHLLFSQAFCCSKK